MATVIAGSAEELRRRPVLSDLIGTISPLVVDKDGIEAALVFAEAGVPVTWVTMPTLGTTAPATKAGAFALGSAELVAATVVLQLASPGAPVLHSTMQSWADPRSGNFVSFPLDGRTRALATELAHHWGVPAESAACGTDSAVPGTWQAGVEEGLDLAQAAQEGSDLMPSIGLVNVYTLFYPEHLILGDDIYRRARYSVMDIDWGDERDGAGRDRRGRPRRALPRQPAHAPAHARGGQARDHARPGTGRRNARPRRGGARARRGALAGLPAGAAGGGQGGGAGEDPRRRRQRTAGVTEPRPRGKLLTTRDERSVMDENVNGAQAQSAEMRRGIAGMVRAGGDATVQQAMTLVTTARGDTTVQQAAAMAIVSGGDTSIKMAGAVMVPSLGDVSIEKGGAQWVVSAGDVSFDKGGCGVAVAPSVRVDRGGIGVALGWHVEVGEGGRVMFGPLAAAAFGLAFGLGFGVVTVGTAGYAASRVLKRMPRIPFVTSRIPFMS